MQIVNKASYVGFILGYLLFFYLTMWSAMKISYGTIDNSWEILGEYENKMKVILIIYPMIAVVFGIALASISVLSYSAMGSDMLTPAKFFSVGWFCIFLANISVLSAALQLFIDKDVGQEWIQAVGDLNFKAIFYFLAPSIGYIGGVISSIILYCHVNSQRSDKVWITLSGHPRL